MDTLHRCCAGLDVHKDSLSACVRRLLANDETQEEVPTFGTTTAELLALLDWLQSAHVPIVAMESTGVYWKPVFNVLEGSVRVLLVNAEQIKQVEGRKTDAGDCAWIAQLLQHGLLRPSFVPERPIRDLRDLTRQRTQLTGERSAAANRIQKVLEDANIKLASVATDVLGVSGRAMLVELIEGGDDPETLAQQARGRLRAKIPQLREALRGRVTDHQRFLLRLHLDHLAHLDGLMERITGRIDDLLFPPPPEPGPGEAASPERVADATAAVETPTDSGPVAPTANSGSVAPLAAASALDAAVERLTTVPGVSRRTAEVVVAEIGANRGQFATAGHLASWAGICPGNNESAGKRRSGKVRRGKRWLKQALVQAAWAASRCKEGYFPKLYRSLSQRRGRKRALLAVAHALLVTFYHLLSKGEDYRDPLTGDGQVKARAEVA
jgi:transposase